MIYFYAKIKKTRCLEKLWEGWIFSNFSKLNIITIKILSFLSEEAELFNLSFYLLILILENKLSPNNKIMN